MKLNRYLVSLGVGLFVGCLASLPFVPYRPRFIQVAIPLLWLANASCWLLLSHKRPFTRAILALGSTLAFWLLFLWLAQRSLAMSAVTLCVFAGGHCLVICLMLSDKTAQGFILVQHSCIVFIAMMGLFLQNHGISQALETDDLRALMARALFYPPLFIVMAKALGSLRAGVWSKVVILFAIMQIGNGFIDLWGYFGIRWSQYAAFGLWISSAVGLLYLAGMSLVSRKSSATS